MIDPEYVVLAEVVKEETYRIGLLFRQDDGTDIETPFQTVVLQFLWSLGPHKPHVY